MMNGSVNERIYGVYPVAYFFEDRLGHWRTGGKLSKI